MRNVPLVVCLGLASVTGLLACTARSTAGANDSESNGECSLLWTASEDASIGVAPFSLTTQDGTGLELLKVVSRAHVEDPLAFTELHLVFRNPERPRRSRAASRSTCPPARPSRASP